MSKLDRQLIDEQLSSVIDDLINFKESLSEENHLCLDMVSLLHNNMATLSFITFLLGQEFNNMMYKEILPEEIFNEIEADLDSCTQEGCDDESDDDDDDDEDCICDKCVCELSSPTKDDKKLVN